MSNVSGRKRTWKNSGLIGNRTMSFAISGRNAMHWVHQANWRAGHSEFVIYPMVEKTWIEIWIIFWTADKDMNIFTAKIMFTVIVSLLLSSCFFNVKLAWLLQISWDDSLYYCVQLSVTLHLLILIYITRSLSTNALITFAHLSFSSKLITQGTFTAIACSCVDTCTV